MSIQWYGVLAALLTSVVAGLILWRTRIDLRRSLSMHVADNKTTYLIFGVISTISIVLMTIFMSQWFIPNLQLPLPFAVLMFLGLACQFVSAWVPHTTGWQASVHVAVAYAMAVLMMPILLFLPFSPVVPAAAGIVIGILLLGMVVTFTSVLFTHHTTKYFLFYQLLYVAGFFVAIGIATFTAVIEPQTSQVKQQNIPMSADDFKDDPRIQGVMQDRSQQDSAQPTAGPSGTGAGNLLQPQ